MKLPGIIGLCSSIAMTGFYLSYLQGRRLKFLKSLQCFFDKLGELCSTGIFDFSECMSRLSDKELYFTEHIISGCTHGANLKLLWEDAVKSGCPFYVDGSTKRLLLSFSEALGKSTREDFCRRCADFAGYAEKAALSEEKKRESNRSLPVYAGVLTAAALFFILI